MRTFQCSSNYYESAPPQPCALELTILCATRTSETLKMRWGEINLERAI